jgi:N-acylneuraminate cytidylyltransferase
MNLGVIAARGGSKGFPGKNLRRLAGLPLIAHTIRAAQRSRLLDAFLVTTDDPAIAEEARAAGASVPFMRPPELATDDIPIWPAVLHATEQWEKAAGRAADAVVLLQPTSPLRTAEDIDGCIARFWDSEADICSSVVATHDSPYFNMVEPAPGEPGLVRPCTPVMADRSRRQEAPSVYAVNGAVYVIRRAVLQDLQNQFRVGRYVAYEMPRARSVDIDGPEDLELAEWLLARARQALT